MDYVPAMAVKVDRLLPHLRADKDVRQQRRVKANTVEQTVKSWQAVAYFALSPCGRGKGEGVAPVSSTLRTRRLVVPSPPHPNPLPQGEREPEVPSAKGVIANSPVLVLKPLKTASRSTLFDPVTRTTDSARAFMAYRRCAFLSSPPISDSSPRNSSTRPATGSNWSPPGCVCKPRRRLSLQVSSSPRKISLGSRRRMSSRRKARTTASSTWARCRQFHPPSWRVTLMISSRIRW